MFEWISENIATLIVCAVLIALVAAVIVFMIRNRKKGRGSCPCGSCGGCAMKDFCHSSEKAKKRK